MYILGAPSSKLSSEHLRAAYGMPYDPIQGQDQGHGDSEVPKIAVF